MNNKQRLFYPSLAVDKSGKEKILIGTCFERKPCSWKSTIYNSWVNTATTLPKGTIYKILGYDLTWEDEPVELK